MSARFDPITNAIQWILPDLSRLDWRLWPMYSLPPKADEALWAMLMAAGYIVLMIWLAVTAFKRREFA